MSYPEHDKLNKVSTKSQVLVEFLNWLPAHGLHLSKFKCVNAAAHEPCGGGPDCHMTLIPFPVRIEQLLANFFGIDLTKLEQEKRDMSGGAQ